MTPFRPSFAGVRLGAVLAAAAMAWAASGASAASVPEATAGAPQPAASGPVASGAVATGPAASGPAAPASAATLAAPDVEAASTWVLLSRGRNHLIFADLAASQFAGGAVSTRFLTWHALGILGPERTGHLRLENARVSCDTGRRTTSAAWLMAPDLTVLASAPRQLAREQAEPAVMWEEVGRSLCGLSPPSARPAAPQELLADLTAQLQAAVSPSVPSAVAPAAPAGGAGPAAPRFLALTPQAGPAPRVPVIAALGQMFLAADGDCAVRPDGVAVQVRAGAWTTGPASCANTDFTREIDLLSVFLADSAPTLAAAARKAALERPVRSRTTTAATGIL